MATTLLTTKRVEKPWGRQQLWPGFADPADDGAPVGEIWFEAPGDMIPDLLVKYLFTSEKLSVQVHPDDSAARSAGYPRGKDEAWVILDAEPDATIALGTLAPMDQGQLRAAALDGSIVDLLDWKPVKAGDYFYSAAGTIHAIGAGITLVEVQQNVDLTYRLYDYDRPRELHLDAGVAVSDAVPFMAPSSPGVIAEGRVILAEGPKFVLERWGGGEHSIRLPDDVPGWLIPIKGHGTVDALPWQVGQCLMVSDDALIDVAPGSDVLFAYPGATRI